MRFVVLGDASAYHTHRWVDSLREAGHDVLALSLEPSVKEGMERIRVVSPPKLKYLMAIGEVRRRSARFSPHVLFAHFLPNYGLIGSFVHAPLKVLALWGSDILHWAFKSPIHRAAARRIVRSYDMVLVDANFVRDILLREFGYPEDRVEVIPFGVERRVREMGMVELPESPLHFVSIRRHEDLFNHGEVMKFLRLVADRYPVRITYLQTGSRTEELKALARRLNLNVNFTGILPYSEYLRVLRSAHFCISIPDRDASSVSLLECMALGGVPVVSDIPANREWVGEDGGIVAPPKAEALFGAFTERYDHGWWSEARARNRRLILQRCDWERNLRRFLKRIEDNLGS
ncbi:MAG: glycosyltransferase family 4 protein [Thermotogae bacterium]|nr:glycosyltransferase family 4 protein [Thermotogota bacterium]